MLPTAQRTIRLLWWLMLLLCFMPLAGRGRDAQGNYVALGFGSEACQTFLQARSNGLDMAYRHWLTGYLTAVNKLTHNTVDMRGTTDTDGILWLLEQYCIKHPLHSFSRAVEFLVTDLLPKAPDTHATRTIERRLSAVLSVHWLQYTQLTESRMRLYFVRHGESEANILRVISNRGYRDGLTARGQQQAITLAQHLKHVPISGIFSSPLRRAVETADILIAEAHPEGLQCVQWGEVRLQYREGQPNKAPVADFL